jgi:ATP-binding cassette subfamily F protein uup
VNKFLLIQYYLRGNNLNILTAEKISKSYSEKILFDEISLGINEGEKIGVIGINGTGKSTLLKVIAGIEVPDKGRIITSNNMTIDYLPQNPKFQSDATVIQQVFKGNTPIMKTLRDYEIALHLFNENNQDEHLGKNVLALSLMMDSIGAWSVENEVKSVLTKLGIYDFQAKVGILSGGQKKRIAMASALISPAELLILDEPTNHIDNETVDWLESYLNKRKGALLMVTHDRYFLERVVNRIIELDRGNLYSYQANYSKFLELKAERAELEVSFERKSENLYKKELEWIRKGAKARSTKQKARIDRFEILEDKKITTVNDRIEIKAGATRLGRKTIEIEHISKSYPAKMLIHDFNYTFLKDDRVGFIGPNGCGKSTLLNIISSKIKPDEGEILIGTTVKIGMFSQESLEMNENLKVIEYIREEAEIIKTTEGTITASQMLELFLFPSSEQWTPISKLSGGERRRLYLLRVLMSAPNVLMLDEPTNDLDIKTLTILENYLDEFPGVVIVVSHDRYFLDRVVDKIFAFEEDGIVKQYAGGYSSYRKILESTKIEDETLNAIVKIDNSMKPKKERALKFTYKEQKEFELIDEVIANIENEINVIDNGINEAQSDFIKLQELQTKKETFEDQLLEAIERWTYLSELAEKIERNK